MKVVLFGATGMIGQGVLRQCLLEPEVTAVLSVARRTTGKSAPKLRELVVDDFTDFSPIADELTGYDACFFCLGVSSAGMSEADYTRVTYDVAVAAGRTLLEQNPNLTFVFVSGAGTDSTERGSTMWARVKGRAENAILAMPFKASYVMRPAAIMPVHGERSRATVTRVGYAALGWLLPVVKMLYPRGVTTTERLGLAMLELVKHGSSKRVLESGDIDELGRQAELEPS
ncbi:MAG TPA: NAD(P)H-binding protein [Polyangiaceae bacterium]